MNPHYSLQAPATLVRQNRALYRRTLLEDVMPFWLRHGFDSQYGGIGNILDAEGNTIGHDKYLWSQGRALYTFSALYNRVEKREEWLGFARHIFAYLTTHGRDDRDYWMYRLDKEGNVLDADTSLYVDGFVMNGMAEYFAATGDSEALAIALQTYETVAYRLTDPGSYQTAPYTIPPGMKALGVAMIFSLFFFELGEIAARPDISRHGARLGEEILTDFYQPSKNAILELVTLDGRYRDTPQSNICVPGHAIEALWFLISIFERTGQHEHIPHCCKLIHRHLELGWDTVFGGLRLAIDVNGNNPIAWKQPDCKPWWVQVEAMVSTAYAYLHTREDWCLDWHQKIQHWAYNHYPVPAGEWRQWLNQRGHPIESAGLPVKDPFHLPRALIYLDDIFNRISLSTQQQP